MTYHFKNEHRITIDEYARRLRVLKFIVFLVSEFYGIKENDILGRRRTRVIVDARQIVYFFAYRKFNVPMHIIGEFIGRRGHDTILYGIKKYDFYIRHEDRIVDVLFKVDKIIFEKMKKDLLLTPK